MPDQLTGWTSYLLRQGALRAQAEVAASLAALELRAPHHAVMAMIESETRSQTQLARALQTDRTTMVAIVDELEAMQFVERQPGATDRRVHEIKLTRKGSRALARSRELLAAADARLLDGLHPRQRRHLRELLLALIHSYDRRVQTKERPR